MDSNATPEALAWVRESLSQGSALCLAIAEQLPSSVPAEVILDGHGPAVSPGDSYEYGVNASLAVAHVKLNDLLLSRYRAEHTLLIESTLLRVGDPDLPPRSTYVGDRVLQWIDGRDIDSWAEAIRAAPAGDVLNACVLEPEADTSYLRQAAQLSPEGLSEIVAAISELVVSAFDGEGYLVLHLGRGPVSQ